MAWWRALDDKLAPRGGGATGRAADVRPSARGRLANATLSMPSPTRSRAASTRRRRARRSRPCSAILTGVMVADGAAAVDASRVRILGTGDAVAQARAVAKVVSDALASGAAVERIAIAFPVLDERTLAPLRRALDDEGIVWSRGSWRCRRRARRSLRQRFSRSMRQPRSIATWWRGCLRSGWIDAARLLAKAARESERRLTRLARALETSATAAGADAVERLVRTATMRSGGGRPCARTRPARR